ncbi:MAG: exo-alpha-sialidase [bacterium]
MDVQAGRVRAASAWVLAAAIGCGGGGGSGQGTPPPGSRETRVSSTSPFPASCGETSRGTLYPQAEVEPHAAINPVNPANLVAVWQQDRWSDGGARGLVSGASFDGGRSWERAVLPVSACAGGGIGASYGRASDPWITFSPRGVAFAIALSFTGASFQPDSTSAVLVVRSTDGGRTWSPPAVLIADGGEAFDDKETITADPNDGDYVYAVWDRLVNDLSGPSWLARTVDGGASWEPARILYDPGPSSQTLGNLIAVLGDGTVIALFTQIDTDPDQTQHASLRVLRSSDHGASWSAPITIAELLAIGAVDPETQVGIRDSAGIAQLAVAPDDTLLVTWQDARFGGGQREGIVLARSDDGGLTWSEPAPVNGEPAVEAFTPAIAVRDDGTIGVLYSDFRDNTSDPRTLWTDLWLAESRDGVTWTERQVAGPFDLALAPNARGLFVGDYQALVPDGDRFVPVYARTNTRSSNPTDVYAWDEDRASAAVLAASRARSDEAVRTRTPELTARVSDTLASVRDRRLPFRR